MARWRRAGTAGRDDASPLTGTENVRRVRAVLALGGVPWDEVEDGVQEVRLKLIQTQAGLDGKEIRSPEAWMSVVASRVAADWHRARIRDTGLRERLATRWAKWPPDHPQEDRDLALTVANGLEQLTLLQRQVVALRFYADLPVHDIARLLDVPEGTVKSRLNSAVAALRTRMRDMEVI
ncbi:sigma-70 family RNA polymerase sigma factor [Streptomyces sp. N2-109]|uniref:Sigma-70 family RNA polymerase sigma factor n=1 Tax=Streptomyces gossypii TaxID=2883101 RepID=A0ABT2JKG7_9ACTN|nr:sigma-70 family RNA polymerase sigma factor [Streptomyces gossypii]MCT2588372.1 sigma-70 family RNA polymerase sigma factor [Streptomyces gossypii]